jgi:hypothetical protein
MPRTSSVTRSHIKAVDSAIEADLVQREMDREHERALAEIRLKTAEAELLKQKYQSQSSQAALEMEAQSRRESDAHKERLLAMEIKLMELKLLSQSQASGDSGSPVVSRDVPSD